MAGAIDLDEIATSEILDPRQVEGHHHRVRVPEMFYQSFRAESRQWLECRPSRRRGQWRRYAVAELRFSG